MEICCGVVSNNEVGKCDGSSRAARRRRMEIRRFKYVAGEASPVESAENADNSNTMELSTRGMENCSDKEKVNDMETGEREEEMTVSSLTTSAKCQSTSAPPDAKFGMASVCGRRRDMEDAVSIHPFFIRPEKETATDIHYYAVYDGHGCSHVATKCRDRFHELVKEEIENEAIQGWQGAMERSFTRMDKEVTAWIQGAAARTNCRCELQMPDCEAVGSAAVVAVVTPDKIIVANCGDSRAVLCRNGRPVPLSSDHKPDRPDELSRIEEAGGRVIYWDCPRVLGVLAMSRAIGDNYLKPYVSCEPEVTITDRTAEDECLILASDGLWDVVSNDTACGVAQMCLRGKFNAPAPMESEGMVENSDKACSDASTLLTKLALARESTDNVSVVVVNLKHNTYP